MTLFARIAILSLVWLSFFTSNAVAWDRGHVDRFATLPDGAAAPEGITVDRHGNVYVTTFAAGGTSSAAENLYVFDSNGKLKSKARIAGSSRDLLGIDFNPVTGDLLVVDIAASDPTIPRRVWRVRNAATGAADVFTTIPGAAGPNALAFDGAGNVYISDSFQGAVWRTGPAGGTPTQWVKSPLLDPNGVPPFGANGLGFNSQGDLFVANTSTDTIVRVPVSNGAPGTPVEFANSVNGADGLLIDEDDNLWVCANQADEIVVIDRTGKAISKLGDFEGVRGRSPVGLLFPASLARDGNWLYVTNLSLDLRNFGHPAVDSQWAAKVKRHTISRLRMRVLGFERGEDD